MSTRNLSRPLRADARRNRDAILAAAAAAFENDGVDVSMDEIARTAGVGNATLYRHFATRDDLVFEVLRHGIDELMQRAEETSARESHRDALAQWLVELIWQLRVWHGLPESIMTALNDAASPGQLACAPLAERTNILLEQARNAGAVRGSITGEELFQLAAVLSWGVDRFGDSYPQAQRRIDLTLQGILHNQ